MRWILAAGLWPDSWRTPTRFAHALRSRSFARERHRAVVEHSAARFVSVCVSSAVDCRTGDPDRLLSVQEEFCAESDAGSCDGHSDDDYSDAVDPVCVGVRRWGVDVGLCRAVFGDYCPDGCVGGRVGAEEEQRAGGWC